MISESEQQNNKEHNDTEINDFSLGFINDDDPNKNFIEDGNMDDYSSSPSFEVVEEIKVNHGMLVSTRQVVETFFHQIVPSQTVQVHLINSVMAHNNHYVENAEAMLMIMENKGSSLRNKVKAYVMGKLIKPSKTIASAIVFVFALVLMHCVYLKEEVEIWNESNNEVWFVGVKSHDEKGLSAILKKIGIFLTISLALCTMWANQNMIVNP